MNDNVIKLRIEKTSNGRFIVDDTTKEAGMMGFQKAESNSYAFSTIKEITEWLDKRLS